MITNKDLEIENISYTNKDFGQIYPELVELAKSLTNKWDPTSTNESDPGIVLLKLIAFIGDKLNYNIDKNALEQFITSATQESSMRELTEIMGYNMHYYRSATSSVTFRYLGDMGKSSDEASDVLATASQITLKAFNTTFKTDDDIVYTLLKDITVYSSKKYTDLGADVIQGQLTELSLTGSDSNLIQLYNLDDNNRIYFPDVEVAENGIFINKDEGVYDGIIITEQWHRVDNLNDQELGQKIFKFGFDSNKGYPYIEFPKDIATLIADGLSISYVISNGVLGNVNAGKLSTINSSKIYYKTSDSESELQYNGTLDDSSYLLNNSASTEAKDPETLNEAYVNFKSTIGTFDTLVSCRDYSNYLKNYLDNLNSRLVSNVQVTDIRTDPDYSKEIMSRDSYGNTYYPHVLLADSSNSLDLVLHGLTPINTTINSASSYNATYYPLSSADLLSINNNDDLSEIKSLVHIFKLPEGTKINHIEARYKLQCNIVLKNNLSTTEQLEVLQNIRQSLYTNYNSMKVDFGEELPYENLISVIENADTRIKNVNLADPDISYFAKLEGVTDYIDLSNWDDVSKTTITQCIGDNILAGRLPLYLEDDSFSYTYDMNLSTDSSLTTVNYLACVKASLNIDPVTDTPRPLKVNEGVQLIQDSYLTQITYPAYIYYSFTTTLVTPGEIAIPKNTVYKLKSGETLYIQYTDSSDIVQFIKYTEGDIIQATFDIVNLQSIAKINNSNINVENTVASKFVNWDEKIVNKNITYAAYTKDPAAYPGITPLFAIGTDEQINILKRNEITLPKNNKCFWYIAPKVKKEGEKLKADNEENNLKFTTALSDDTYQYILEEGEYFVYPTDDMLSLNILGSGTKLICNTPIIQRTNPREIIDLTTLTSSIMDSDVGTFEKSYSWQTLPTALTIVETSISNFIAGDVINKCPAINDTWAALSGEFEVKDTTLNISAQANPFIRTLLSINCSADNPQYIDENQTVYYSSSTTASETAGVDGYEAINISPGYYIQISPVVDTYNNLGNLQVAQYEQSGSKLIRKIDATNGNTLHDFTYKLVQYTNGTPIEKSIQHFINAVKDKVTVNARNEYVIPFDVAKEYFSNSTTYELTCNINKKYGLTISIFDSHALTTQLIECDVNTKIDLTNFINEGNSTNYLYISLPKKLTTYPYLNTLGSDAIDALKVYIADSHYNAFDPLAETNSYKLITSYTPLYSYLDKNNIYNKLTISKIDFENSVFNIVGGSRSW